MEYVHEKKLYKIKDGIYKVEQHLIDYYTEDAIKNLVVQHEEKIEQINKELLAFSTEKETKLATDNLLIAFIGKDMVDKKNNNTLTKEEEEQYNKALSYVKNLLNQTIEKNKKDKKDIEEALIWWKEALEKGSSEKRITQQLKI